MASVSCSEAPPLFQSQKEVAMDIATLTTLAVTALTTFLAGAADGAAHKAGEAVYEQGKHIYEAIRARFSTEADGDKASQALTTLASDPDYRPVVEQKLARILQADSTFAELLQHLVQGPCQLIEVGDDAEAEVDQSNRARAGSQEVHGGDRSRIKARQKID